MAYNWSGFYLGVNAGYGRVASTGTATLSSPIFGVVSATSSGNASGAVAGGQFGANWQSGMLVLGIEGDIQWSGQKENLTTGCGAGCTLTETGGVDWFGTARARIGAAFDRVLIYGTGGVAWTGASDSLNASALGLTVNVVSLTSNHIGWTVGGGVEFPVTDNLTMRSEYLYVSTSITNTAPLPALFGGGTVSETAQLKDSIARVGLNYKFGGGAIMARY